MCPITDIVPYNSSPILTKLDRIVQMKSLPLINVNVSSIISLKNHLLRVDSKAQVNSAE